MLNKKQIYNLTNILGRFKDLKRSGWLKRGVLSPESDADHSFSVCFLTFLLAPEHLNRCRCLELALIHDLAELYSGDYTPCDNISPAQKHILEEQGIQRIAQELESPRLLDLFAEFEAQETAESRFVKAIDKLDTVFAACYYDCSKRSETPVFAEFSAYARKQIEKIASSDIESIQNILNILISERENHDQN